MNIKISFYVVFAPCIVMKGKVHPITGHESPKRE